jgi:hypothetical protein
MAQHSRYRVPVLTVIKLMVDQEKQTGRKNQYPEQLHERVFRYNGDSHGRKEMKYR